MSSLPQCWRQTTPQTIPSILNYGLKSGLYSDVGFLIGEERIRINAHKIILMLRSEVFEIMFSENWNEHNTSEPTVVELRENNPLAFGAFVEFVYTDELEPNLSLEILLEVMSLGKMYQFPVLVKKVARIISGLMQPETAIKIYEYGKLLDEEISRESMGMVKRNLPDLLTTQAYLHTGLETLWHWETWEELLNGEEYLVEEIVLFKALERWSRSDTGIRHDHFHHLIQLIRYPLMGCKVFREQVVPTDLLPKEDVITMFLFLTDMEGYSPTSLKYLYRSRSITRVSNSDQLSQSLLDANAGDVIQLEDGEYSSGPFHVGVDFLTIRGGKKTLIKSADYAEYDTDTPPAIQLTGSACTLDKITFNGPTTSILVTGHRNHLQNLTFLSVKQGIKIKGDSNLVQNTNFSNLQGLGIKISGEGNLVDNLNSKDTDSHCILALKGNQNKVNNLSYISKPCSNIDNRVGIVVKSGRGHEIEGLTSPDEYNADSLLQTEDKSVGVTVRRVKSGMEIVVSGDGHVFCEIVAKNKIEVGGRRHRFERCETEEWEVFGGVGGKHGHVFSGCGDVWAVKERESW